MVPSYCSKCLSKNNLINYTSEWKTTYIREWPEKITRKSWFHIPICQSCKKELLKNERNFGVKGFAILAPLTFGVVLVSWLIPSVGGYLLSFLESIRGPIGTVLVIIWLLLFLGAIVSLFMVFWPHIFVNWPVKFEKHHVYDIQTQKRTWTKDSEWTETQGASTFSFDNKKYAKLFAVANPNSSLNLIPDSAPNLNPIETHIKNLKNKDSHTRQTAALTLGKIKDIKAVEALIQVLKDESMFVRDAAAISLGEIGDIRAVEALTEATEDKNRLVRRTAKKALEKIKKATAEN